MALTSASIPGESLHASLSLPAPAPQGLHQSLSHVAHVFFKLLCLCWVSERARLRAGPLRADSPFPIASWLSRLSPAGFQSQTWRELLFLVPHMGLEPLLPQAFPHFFKGVVDKYILNDFSF